jgi:hypothetical protein
VYFGGMDEFIKQGQWWWLLIVPIATFVFALGGSWWGTNLGKITEHEQWLRNQKQAAYQKFVAIAQANSQNVYSSISPEQFDKRMDNENQRMQAYWELNVVASEEVADEAYKYIHEYKAYISLIQETNVVREVVMQRIAAPKEDDTAEFIDGLRQYLKDQNLEDSTAVAVRGYQKLMLRVHLVIDAMRRDLKLAPMGEDDDGSDPRSNPIENQLKKFRSTLPQGDFDSPIRHRHESDDESAYDKIGYM